MTVPSDRQGQPGRPGVDEQAVRVAAERARSARRRVPPPTLTVARAVLASVDRQTMPEEVVSLVATLLGVPEAWVGSGDRHPAAIEARGIAALAMAARLGMSYPEVARWVGGSPHHASCRLSAVRMAGLLSIDIRSDYHGDARRPAA